MKSRKIIRENISRALCGLLIAASFASADLATAQDQAPWPVKGKLLGKKDKKAEDVSGIACSASSGLPRTCLLIDDEAQGAQIVIVKEGELAAGQPVRLIDDAFNHKPLELDGEGVAYADGAFYVIGSHGHPRDKDKKLHKINDAKEIAAKIKASSQIIRLQVGDAAVDADGNLKIAPKIQRSAALAKFLAADPALKPFVNRRLDQNGLTIEGVAVRERRLYAGMRGPSLDGKEAAVLSLALGALFDGAAADARLHRLEVGPGRGVRDLVVLDTGFLVLAGPAADVAGPYSVYFWNGDTQTRLLANLHPVTDDGKQLKPEAILPLDRSATELRVLVFFDGAKEGAPRPVQVPYP